jgi:hypothetical protein
MNVQIYDQRPGDASPRLKTSDGSRYVREKAETLSPVGHGVVVSAAEIDRDPVIEREQGRENRPSGCDAVRHDDRFGQNRRLNPAELRKFERL